MHPVFTLAEIADAFDSNLVGAFEQIKARYLPPADLLQADLWLSVFDEQGAPQKFPSEDFVKRVSDRLVGRWLQQEQEADTTVVLQVLCVEPGDSMEAREACAGLLAAARQSLSRTLCQSPQPR